MEKFLKKIDEKLTNLVSSGDKIVVGVSGGADSIALLHVLHLFSKTKNYDLVVAHINHMARGGESFVDADFVKEAAEKLGLRFFLKEIDVEDKKVQFKKSFQETARLIRYQFFDEISTVNVFVDGFSMLKDILKLKHKQSIGYYS